MARISEEELIVPALKVMNSSINGTVSTSDLINELTATIKPTGEDMAILNNRNDTKFSQKVRNLKSHNTITKLGLATFTPNSTSGTFTITDDGRAYLIGK
jgi:hypothetical protein